MILYCQVLLAAANAAPRSTLSGTTIVSYKSTFIAPRVRSCSQARGTGRKQNTCVAAGYGYLRGGDLIVD